MRKLLIAMMTLGSLSALAGEPMHVTYLWHMHQPVYYPYERVQDTDSAGRFNFSIAGVINDRTPNYTVWPKDAVQQGADKGMAHAGAQCSFSGSLAENLNNLWGGSWNGDYRWARNGLRTSLNNPRLDMVGIPYHHSLMPLTCKESMKMQIRLHKEQYKDVWNTGGDYSKGFWPPECAFAEWIIPALVEEGMQWVIVDNGHLFRAVEGFPWNSGSSCRPNPADVQNPSAEVLGSQWVQLNNVWAPTKVLAPWAYQPHYVQYVNPNDGTVQKIIAVPAGRYEGNENGRGGYGAFKPENVWGSWVSSVNTDAQHPMLLLCHSDGDNYGMKNADAWNGQHGNFLEMCKSNPDFENTTVQDYLQMYPPNANDIIHVEPGSWVGIDGGTPYFEKWLSSTYVNGENPDHWSWSVLVAAQNHVILADTLENSYSMNDVEWGIGGDTAKAWHYYLNGETSCYWYWDMDRGNPWDGNVTRACNTAIGYANAVLARHSGVDTKGPSIFPPQRSIYNPGGYMWNETTPASSDFSVWSYVYDVSGLASVKLYWRTDKDGKMSPASIDNMTYAGGAAVNAWNIQTMTGSWDPTVKGPDNIVPNPTARAQQYSATIAGQNNVLIDYFVEAVDAKGNTNRSDIMHVYVGQSSGASAVTFMPATPTQCDPLVVTYNSASRPLAAANPITLMISFDSWATTNEYTMSGAVGGLWRVTNAIASNAVAAKVRFRNGGTIDNNGGQDWSTAIAACATPPVVLFNPPQPVGCDGVTISYAPNNGPLQAASPISIHVGYNGWQGVVTPDPVMTYTGGVWRHTYQPPVGAYEIDVCFNNGSNIWDNNNGQNYRVAVSNCSSTNAVVTFTPGAPDTCDNNIAVTYNPEGRSLAGASNIYVFIDRDGVWRADPMSPTGALWRAAGYGVTPSTTQIRVFFANAAVSPTIADGSFSQYWSVAVSQCISNGPSLMTYSPASPAGCNPVTITYRPNNGPLQSATNIHIHIGHDGWQGAITPDPSMTPHADGSWTYLFTPQPGTEQINICFNDGAVAWDNHATLDWVIPVTGCGAPPGIRFVAGSPYLPQGPTNQQNYIGESFDLNRAGGYASTSNQGGFGSFGQVYVNYDANNFYIGGLGVDMTGSNNAMAIFLEVNTLGDNANNLWAINGAPDGLDRLHNVWFNQKADVVLLLGDEWGDGTFTNFNLGNGYNMGQGIYYLSSSGSFVPVAGAHLTQFDGTGTVATVTTDDDGARLTKRWKAGIPWSSLGSTNGIAGITNCWLYGLIVSDGTNGTDRYISGNYLGASVQESTNGNYGFSFIHINGIAVGLPQSDSNSNGVPDSWELENFGTLGAVSRGSDWDGDGFPDQGEWAAGTLPRNGSSLLRMEQIAPSFSGLNQVTWQTVGGRTYDIQCATDLMGGFTNLTTVTEDSVSNGVASMRTWVDMTTTNAQRFYRVKIAP